MVFCLLLSHSKFSKKPRPDLVAPGLMGAHIHDRHKEIKIDFEVLPVATCQGRIHHFSLLFLGLPCGSVLNVVVHAPPFRRKKRRMVYNLLLYASLRCYFDIKYIMRSYNWYFENILFRKWA